MSSLLWLEPRALAPLPTPPWAHGEGALPLLYLIDLLNPPVDAIKGPAVCVVVHQDHTLGRQQASQWPARRPLRHTLTMS